MRGAGIGVLTSWRRFTGRGGGGGGGKLASAHSADGGPYEPGRFACRRCLDWQADKSRRARIVG